MLRRTANLALAATLVVAAAALSLGSQAHAGANGQEAKLLDVLQSDDAKLKAKVDACRQLAHVGTKPSVPVLVKLLGDEKLHHMARYALEPNPDPSVGAAFREALGELKGRALIGVIDSIGVRRDAEATQALAGLLTSADAGVAEAAARALGDIGSAEAAKAVQAALPKAPAGSRQAFFEGLFRCAEALTEAGETEAATGIYDRVRAMKNTPHHVHAAALRGAVLIRGEDGVPLLLDALRGKDYTQVMAAARTAMEMPQPEVTKALADELGKLPLPKQILLTKTLGVRGDAAATPALLALAKQGDKRARVAAIRALPEIGDASAVPVLLSLLGDAEGEVAQAAELALSAVAGPKVDAHLIEMLDADDAETRRLAVSMLAQRRVEKAVPALMKAARQDKDEEVRVASIKALGDLAGVDEFPALVDLLAGAKSSADIRALESALSGLCTRLARPAPGKVTIQKAVYGDLPDGKKADVTKKVAAMVKRGSLSIGATNDNFGDPCQGTRKKFRVEYTVAGTRHVKTVEENDTVTLTAGVTPPACIDALRAALDKAPPKPKLALLRVLRTARGPKALAAVRKATQDPTAEVREAAVSILCGWPSVEALPAVVQLAKTAEDRRTKILAVRGYIRLIGLQAGASGEKLAALKEAMALAPRDEEKKQALAVLGDTPSPGALALATPHLGDPALKEEASLAAVSIAEALVKSQPAAVADAMGKVIEATDSKDTATRARALLARARKRAPKK
ncbi:MAG: HEAT repeat domain-containing protein [bacterium]